MDKLYEIIGPPKENIPSNYPQGYATWPEHYDIHIGKIATGKVLTDGIVNICDDSFNILFYPCEVKEVVKDWDE